MKTVISIEIDTDNLFHQTDEHVAQLWHVTQANPAPYGDLEAGQLAEYVGREIIRRWLADQAPALWVHQGEDHFRKAISAIEAQDLGHAIEEAGGHV